MSRGSKYIRQVIEMDFQYPSEGIHYHWDKGGTPLALHLSTACLGMPGDTASCTKDSAH